jgi:hypothetical protein
MPELDRYALSKKLKQAIELLIEVNQELTREPTPQHPQTADILSKFPEDLRQHLTLKDGKIYKKLKPLLSLSITL